MDVGERGDDRGAEADSVDERRRRLLASALVAPVAAGGLRTVAAGGGAPTSSGGAPASSAATTSSTATATASSDDRTGSGFLDVSRTPDGGYLLVGTTTDDAERAGLGWAVKLDGQLDEQWNRTYLSPEHRETRESGDVGEVHDAFAFALPDGDGGHLLVGWYHFLDADGKNGWVVAVDERGRRRWQREYARPGINTFQNTFADGLPTDDGALLVGRTLASEADDEVHGDGWVVEIDGRGEVVRERTHNTLGERHEGYGDDPRHDEFEAVVRADDGGFVLAGEASPDGPTESTPSAGWVVALDAAGDERWSRTYRLVEDADNELLDLARTDDGFVLCGAAGTDEYERIGPTSLRTTVGRGWAMKVGPEGEPTWQRSPGGEGFEAIAPAGAGHLLVGVRDGAPWATSVDGAGATGSPERSGEAPAGRYTSAVPTDDGHLLVGWERDDPSGSPTGLLESMDGADAEGGRTLVVTKDTAGKAAYLLATTGTVQQGSDSEAVVEGSSALDHVGRNGTDRLRFTGEVADFVLKGDATVMLDGERVDPASLGGEGCAAGGGRLANTLTVRSGGSTAGNYAVTASGALQRGDDSEAAVRGASAVGWVDATGGADTLRYSGSITRFLLKGDAEVYRNGERVEPDDLGG